MNSMILLTTVVMGAVLAGGAAVCGTVIRGAERVRAGRLADIEARLRRAGDEFAGMESMDRQVRERELLLAELYEFTKKMSHALRFEELFKIFISFLREGLRGGIPFKKGEIIILREYAETGTLDRVYAFSGPPPAEAGSLQPSKESSYAFGELFAACVRHRKGELFTREKDSPALDAFGLGPEAGTFAVVPLMSEKRMVCILAVEGLGCRDFDKFAILSMQFALQMKKVLLYEVVESLAITDGLTGLYGRRYFVERMGEELKRAKAHSLNLAFLMADIDHFKACNDTYGHLVGDVVLREIGRIIKESVREIDLVARYGGEEFSVILPEAKKEQAAAVAERVRRRIEGTAFRAYDETLRMTISIGVAAYPDDGAGVRGVIDSADKAMYQAKSDGRNLVRSFRKKG